MKLAELSIADIRMRLAEESDERRVRRLCRALARDRRTGARAVAAKRLRKLDADRAERARLAELFTLRDELVRAGARCVAGVDEVGMGPLAGPVVAAAVVLGESPHLMGLDDSKKLSRAARERLDGEIREQAVAVSIGRVEPDEIDRLNIYRAGLEAMRRAVVGLASRWPVDHLLVDAREVPGIETAQTPIVHGDALDASIAAASIVAKVHRDALMSDLDRLHPGYGFVRHKGYGTAEHMAALARLGASPAHRRSFAPVAAVLGAA